MPFSLELRDKLLLWCDRHCCLCKKACGAFIDVHHIVSKKAGGDDGEDNAIPLCFDCHGKVGSYNHKHPLGNRFRADELKQRRNQIYEQFTRNLVPSLTYRIQQSLGGEAKRAFPHVGFVVVHSGDGPWIHLLVKLDPYINHRLQRAPTMDPMYTGSVRWNLNPKEGVHGHFALPDRKYRHDTDLRVGVHLTIIDRYERHHELLPVTWVFGWDFGEWWLDPVDPLVSRNRDRPRPTRR